MSGEFGQGILDEFKRNELEKMKTNVILFVSAWIRGEFKKW